jgi:uncharacterized protein YggE
MRRLISALALTAALVAVAPAAIGQPAPAAPSSRFETTTLDIAASGEVQATPDMATIDLGVTTQEASAAAALAENAVAMTKVIATLKAAGIEARDIQTSNLSVSPQYVYAQNQPPRLTGYQATNQVAVTVRDLTRLGAAVDAVVNAGATNVGSISFGLISRTPAEDAARLAAVKALQDKAALYANASGYHIRRLVNLTEGAPQQIVRPLMMSAGLAAAAPPTPVESGDLTVRVDVSGEFELSH